MATASPPRQSERPQPVLRTTTYDRSSAALLSLFIGLVVATGIIATLYIAAMPDPPAKIVAVELIDEATGGEEDGEPDSTLLVESELAPQPDAAPVEQDADQTELQETLEQITDLAEQAVEIVPDQAGVAAISSGVAGSADGSGLPSLGSGPGSGGVPRSQRWLVNFADGASLDEYARQLDYFGIELGAIMPDGTLKFASDLSAARPKTRQISDGSKEERLYMNWQGGARKLADQQLLGKAGINAEGRPVLHFYPKQTENLLAQLEKKATTRKISEIRRTYYDVRRAAGAYEFKVRRQIFF